MVGSNPLGLDWSPEFLLTAISFLFSVPLRRSVLFFCPPSRLGQCSCILAEEHSGLGAPLYWCSALRSCITRPGLLQTSLFCWKSLVSSGLTVCREVGCPGRPLTRHHRTSLLSGCSIYFLNLLLNSTQPGCDTLFHIAGFILGNGLRIWHIFFWLKNFKIRQ